ncbi:ubiquinol-cytochrome c oxidoreductase subunit 6 [Scheffersomyces amazonensis]|uniref:ubiquinol-cytochrome c oxidoreductase subunit 6 n=1 Tax=Scheffersomyces amazonensis TaxID=1078765 RepID=UPI00315DF6E9
MSFLKDLIEAVIPAAYAEEPEEEPVEETEEAAEEDDDEEEEEEEEDEDEVEDPLVALTEECKHTPAVHPFLHHFDECVERVTKEQEDPDYASKEHKEDCIEEFFHLQHAINDCVAPRLFNKLK